MAKIIELIPTYKITFKKKGLFYYKAYKRINFLGLFICWFKIGEHFSKKQCELDIYNDAFPRTKEKSKIFTFNYNSIGEPL